jgi:hypothetical protein
LHFFLRLFNYIKKLNIFVNYIYQTNFNFMINNYDSVVACPYTATTHSQKQESTSYTATKRNWLSFVTVLVTLFCFSFVQGQTTLISPTGDGSFEGANFAADGWTTLQGATPTHNNFSIGNSATIGFTPIHGSNGVFVTNNGTTRAYAHTASIAWIYKDVTFPAGETIVTMTMSLLGNTADAGYDGIVVGHSATSYSGSITTGTTGAMAAGTIPDVTIARTTTTNTFIEDGNYATATSRTFTFSGLGNETSSVTRRVWIGFRCDGSVGNTTTPYSFDSVSLTSRAPIAPDAPITFTATALNSAGMTINWVDNSTNETAFKVYRSTDNVTFTQVGSNIAITAGAGPTTGTAYSQVQTGLLPNTTYYYRISSVFEAESTFLTGSQATNAPGTFISVATGNFGMAATWDIVAVPTQYDSVTIDTWHTVTIDASGQAATNVIVKGTLAYGATPTSFAVNGNLTVDAGGVVNVFNATTGKTLTVAGNITNNGTMDFTVGGTASATTGASLLTLNGTTVQTVSGTGTFLNNKIGSLTCSNTSTATPNIIWQFDNILIQHALNLTGARFDIGTRTLSHGSSFNTSTGSLSLTTSAGCGFMPGAKYRRWFTTGATGGGISPGADPTATTSRFPFVNATGTNQRWVHIQRSSSSQTGNTAGYLAVKYNDATTTTTGLIIAESSPAYTITDRYDANWTITAESGYVYASGTHNIAIVANNAFSPSNGNTRLMLAAAPIAGTHQNGTITPGAQRIGLTTAQLTAGDIYMGINAADIPFISVANGDWENPSTWNKNAVPSLTTDIVYIANGTTVGVNATAAVSSAITIFAGGTLNVAGSTLGVTGSLINNGTLNVSGGAMSTTTTVTNGGTITVSGGTLTSTTALTNNASSTITVSGTGTLTSAGNNTLTNSGTINANGGTINVSTTAGASTTGITNNSGATLSVAGGTVNVGPAGGGNRVFSNAGILTVSSGTLDINGSLSHSGTQFNQSGGSINIDGNAAGVTANSASSYHLNMTAVVNWTGGTLTIVDPHASSTSTDVLYYNLATSSNVGTGHTLRFGDGVSSDAGGNAIGFKANTYVGSGRINYGNLVINGGTGTNRIVTGGSWTNVVLGNLTINSSSEYAPAVTVFVAGDFVNNGTFTQTSTLTLATYAGTSSAVATNPQTISGSGVFRNLATSPTANLTSLTVNNSNATGVTLNVPLSISGTLTMTSGIINTTNTNLLTLGTATAAGTLAGTPSATNMIKGPFARTIATANANTNYILFPVGKAAYTPISLAPATTAVTVMKAEAFDSNTGTQNAAIINLTTARRWEAPIVSGTVTDVNVRLADAGILASSIPVQAPTATGEYTNSFGSVATAVAGATTQSNTAVTSANYTGFLSYADSNACSGTPAPGNTIPSTNAICLGTSVTLSLQNATSGTGVTYQWKSSTDGTTYTAITGATNATLTVTPSAPLYYVCDVTCATGPATGTSTAVQITFTNSVTATTPGTRCGTGTVDLSATPSAGASIKWYAAETGGTVLGTGNSFTTPSIAATTTYYAGSESTSPGTAQLGTGTTTSGLSLSAFNNYRASAKYHMIYTASELAAIGLSAGDISSIAYKVTSLGDVATNANYTVKIGTTSLSTFANTTFTAPTFTTCYGPSTYTHTSSGWQTINFSTPYTWDGISNIIIEVSHDGADGSSSANTEYTATTGNTVLYSYNGSNNTLSTSRFNVLFAGQVGCHSARVPVVAMVTTPPALTLSASTATICESNSTSVTLTSTAGDYNTYTWSPSTGIVPGGDENTGWTFNPSVSTNYTLTATQTGGSLCATTATFAVTVNPRPSAMTITPSPAPVCVDAIQALVVNGGTLNNVSILNENFNASTNSWTVLNTSTGGTPADANWTLRNSGYVYSTVGTFISNDASQFYLSNSDDQGSGSTTNTALISPSFATINFTAATVSFWHYFRQNGTAKVQYSIDGGTAWTDIQSYTATTGAIGGFVQANLALPAGALNQANVKIRFKYDAVWQYFWAIDNVSISGTQAQTITWLPIDNLYTDATATTAYVENANASTVYFKSSTTAAAVTYTATSTTSFLCTRTATTDVTVNSNNTVTAASSSPTVCINTAITDITHTTTGATGFATTTTNYGLPAGVTAVLASNTITISGTPTASGTFNYDIPLTGGCGTVSATGTITVTANNTASIASSTPTVCINTAITDITHTTTGATGIATTTTNYGLPAGVTAVLASNTITISGTPTASGTFNYDIPLTGGCGTVSATGTITVTAINTASAASSTPTVCINTAITDITHTTTGATGIATTTTNYGLPAGVTAVLVSNTITISGTPTASGTFNYDIPLTGGCGTVSTTGTITVTAINTASAASSTPTVCINTAITDITHTTTGATGIATTTTNYGLPAGVTAVLVSNTITISGTPTASGTFNYDIPLTGGCGTVSATGTITVSAASTNSTTTSACGTYTWSVNGTTYTTSGTYTSVVGCLTETLNLTINALPITAITRAGDDLTATETGATYQWYTCTSGSVGTMISGATTQSYTVTATGSYAVEVTKNGCSEMSACFDVATLSDSSFDLAKLSYYPNPVIDVLTISYTNEITAVQVYDISGRLVRDMKPNSNEVTVDLSDLAASVYVVKVFADTTSGEFKVVKK